MLRGGNPLTVGVGIIIEVIRKNNSDYDPDIGAADSLPSGRDPIYLGTLLRLFAQHVPDFMALILSPNHTVVNGDGTTAVRRRELKAAFGEKIEPLGFDRFKTCELMAELLHCSNMGLLNERGSERYVKERDRERERLKQEGGFPAARGEVHSNSTDFTEDSTGYQNGMSPPYRFGSGSPEEIRRPDLHNADEVEDFEDVVVSGALIEDVKDDFDERQDPEIEVESSERHEPTRVLNPSAANEDDFVDEPLSPLRAESRPLHDVTEQEATLLPRPTSGVEPLSPTSSGLTAQVGGLDLDNDTIMTSPPSSESCPDEDRHEEPAGTAVPPHLNNADVDPNNVEIALHPHTEGIDRSPVAADHTGSIIPPNSTSPKDLSPHSEDRPEPLFANRLDQHQPVSISSVGSETLHRVGQGDSQETIDTTFGEEGDSIRSVLMSGNDTDNSFGPFVETDIDGKPVVGDFLKMMFVEHRVVPTILVTFPVRSIDEILLSYF
jgi:SIT4-associating protein SAP185/190